MQWYYAIDGERRGPVAQAELEKLVTDGVVKADTLVWQQGMADWQAYARVAGGPAAGAAPAGGADDGTEEEAFRVWTKGGGKVLPGLVKRREAEIALFLS